MDDCHSSSLSNYCTLLDQLLICCNVKGKVFISWECEVLFNNVGRLAYEERVIIVQTCSNLLKEKIINCNFCACDDQFLMQVMDAYEWRRVWIILSILQHFFRKPKELVEEVFQRFDSLMYAAYLCQAKDKIALSWSIFYELYLRALGTQASGG